MKKHILLFGTFLVLIFLLTGCPLFPQNAQPTESQTNESSPPPPPTISVHFIDVGFGESILIQTPSKTAMIDCGSDDQKALAYLNFQGINRINFLVGTNTNMESIGGCNEILKYKEVDEYFDNGEKSGNPAFIDVMYEIDKEDYEVIKKGDILDLGIAKISVLHPQFLSADSSANSLVIKLTYDSIDMLFTGDCIENCEKALLRADINNIDILKIGRFCDKGGTLKEFLLATNPKVAVLFAGQNELGYPDQDCVQRVVEKGAILLRTDQDGTVVLETDGTSIWRQGSALVWN